VLRRSAFAPPNCFVFARTFICGGLCPDIDEPKEHTASRSAGALSVTSWMGPGPLGS